MLVRWRTFKSEGLSTETQLFQSKTNANNKAILFCPGFPGMGGAMFEQRHADALVEEGYDVTVIKHKGTRLDGAMAPMMVNNAARLMMGRKNNEKHLGGGPATVQDWLMEPVPVFIGLSENYDEVHVIGNSFGALSALWSLTIENAPLEKLKSILLYAGAQGIDDGTDDGIMRLWKPEYLMAARITDKVTLNDPFDIVATLQDVYLKLPERMKRIPETVSLSYLVVVRDELLRLNDTEQFRTAIGGKGEIIMDEVDHAWPDYGILAHDTPNYITEDLLKILRGSNER